ncbi:AraC family transcriptional regulator [Sphaerochaeta halotolerans]|jgi:AraC-like DNA-binding protein|uniref:AraC family transcriptional regulator n=1 Tax=Sphaerochaeta halotolerans TaxID=2293840 RepID=A0A372MDY5_9SPIR|nr:helix-turn-helix domain-containing protein [Sphaerochaeta halotolerans]RFU94005.1 AraC family transcriptional regulator [Sphaerochaeta halotolerans]
MESSENRILFKEDFSIKVNDDRNPLFYVFDYGVRSDAMNMEFQHFHDFYELFFLVDDHASHIIEGEYFSLQRYDMVLLKPSLLHMTLYPRGEKPKARLIVAFRISPTLSPMERQVKRLLSIFDEEPPIFRFSGSLLNRILQLFNTIYKLGTERQPGYDLMIHGKFLELLWVIQTNRKINLFTKAEITDSITQKIYEVTSYLHTHYAEELSLQEVADHFSVSSFYLSHQFKRVTGLNFVSFLQQIRVRNAQQLLLYSKMKVKEICLACGFTSFSQFNRVFSKFCGVTPSLFRKNVNHQSEQLLQSLDPERNAEATPSKALQSEDEYRSVKHKEMLSQGKGP